MPNDIPAFATETENNCFDFPPFSAGPALGFTLDLSCMPPAKHITRIQVNGGLLPYVLTTNKGEVASISGNIFEIRIDAAVKSVFGSFNEPPWYAGQPAALCRPIEDIPGGLPPTDPAYDPLTMSTGGNAVAMIRLGTITHNKGIFTVCRHSCAYSPYDCFGRPWFGDTTLGDNVRVAEPFDCPFSNNNQSNQVYSLPGRGLGPCNDAHNYDLASRPPIVYFFSEFAPCTDDPQYAECSGGAPCLDTADPFEHYQQRGGPLLDVRHQKAIALGCSPCLLDQNSDLIVTILDGNGSVILLTIPIM